MFSFVLQLHLPKLALAGPIKGGEAIRASNLWAQTAQTIGQNDQARSVGQIDLSSNPSLEDVLARYKTSGDQQDHKSGLPAISGRPVPDC